jgi:hypothetical protein
LLNALGPETFHLCFEENVDRRLNGFHGKNGTRSNTIAGNIVGRGEVEIKSEGIFCCKPTLHGLLELRLQVLAHIQESRRTRASVEVFIRAPHGQIHIAFIQIHWDGPKRVTLIPEHQCPRLVGSCGHPGHVVHEGALEGHVCQANQGGLVIDC